MGYFPDRLAKDKANTEKKINYMSSKALKNMVYII